MQDHLRITLAPDTDYTGELTASIVCRGFAGVGAAWFDIKSIQDFAARLETTYPLQPSEEVCLAGGEWEPTKPAVLKQEHLALRFYPIGTTGVVGCRILLFEPGDGPQSSTLLEIELRTGYEALRDFALALLHLSRGEAAEAVLDAC